MEKFLVFLKIYGCVFLLLLFLNNFIAWEINLFPFPDWKEMERALFEIVHLVITFTLFLAFVFEEDDGDLEG